MQAFGSRDASHTPRQYSYLAEGLVRLHRSDREVACWGEYGRRSQRRCGRREWIGECEYLLRGSS